MPCRQVTIPGPDGQNPPNNGGGGEGGGGGSDPPVQPPVQPPSSGIGDTIKDNALPIAVGVGAIAFALSQR